MICAFFATRLPETFLRRGRGYNDGTMFLPDETPDELRRDWRLLSIAVFLFAFGFAIYSAVFINFITEKLSVNPLQMGALESMREIPGLLAVAIAASVAAHAETRIGAVCLVLSALGVAATGFVHTFAGLVIVTVFWSVFMHQWFTSSSAIPLALASGQDGGRHLGRMASVGAAGTVLAFLALRPLAGHVPYPVFFVTAAVLILIAGLLLLPISAQGTTQNRPRLLFRREYGLYYILSFLEGSRRQIFSTFAIFALVQVCRTPLPQIASLMLVNAIASFFVAAPVGRLIDRIGERHSMAIYYAAITLAFTGYALTATIHALPARSLALQILYIIDNILFSFGVSITTYLNRIVRPGELTPSLAMGQTMNHVAAVAIPVGGGLLWNTFGYQAPFWAGVLAALASLLMTQAIERKSTRNGMRETICEV